MSCFWDAILNRIQEEDKKKYFNIFNMSLTPHNFVVILKEINKKTNNVLWNNEELTEKQLNENKECIDNYDKNSINNGYDCSTFEPILFLLVEYLNITIHHEYNKNVIIYSHKTTNRYTIIRIIKYIFYSVKVYFI